MKIAIVYSSPYPPEDGIGNYVDRLARTLVNRGHTVHIVTRGNLLPNVDERHGLILHRATFLPIYPFHVDFHRVFVERTLSRIGPDVVHLHSPLAPPVRPDAPVVSTIHTSAVGDARHMDVTGLGSLATKLMTRVSSKRIIAKQLDTSEVVTTVSRTVAEELQHFFGTAGVRVVGNAVDPDEFYPTDDDHSTDQVLFVGRLSYRKGVRDLVDALRYVEPDVICSIVGKGPLREKLERRVKSRSLRDRVEFLGHVSDEELLERYQHASVVVIPSHYEGLPTVLLEAMACGTPCVATSVGGSAEVVDDGKNGVLLEPGRPSKLGAAIARLLENPERRAKLGAAARETVEERFTWETLTGTYVGLYREASEP